MDEVLKSAFSDTIPQPSSHVRARCPHCAHQGSLQPTIPNDLLINQGVLAGIRRCPNIACNGVVFIVRKVSEPGAMLMFPHEKVDFDKAGVPEKVVKLLEEAITCQATQCFTASAILVRKVLEVVCEDQGATGANLHQRLTALASRMMVSADLMDAMKVLKLLGNDAAHVESKDFDNIGEAEINVAIELVKEIVKAVYQHRSLVDKLKALKTT